MRLLRCSSDRSGLNSMIESFYLLCRIKDHKNLFLRAEHYLKHIYKFQGNENGKINNCFEKQILFINYLIERLECNLIFQQNKSNFGKSNYFLCKKNIFSNLAKNF